MAVIHRTPLLCVFVCEDSPPGYEVMVVRAKKGATIDSNCYYTLRGSFQGIKQHELRDAMNSDEAVAEKLLVSHTL